MSSRRVSEVAATETNGNGAAPPVDTPAPATPPAPPKSAATGNVPVPPPGARIKTRTILDYETNAPNAQPLPAGAQPLNPIQQTAVNTSGRISNLAQWLSHLQSYDKHETFQIIVTRKADPPRLPGTPAPFRRSVAADEELGMWELTTTYGAFVQGLQALNHGSGGLFYVQVLDEDGMLLTDEDGYGDESGEWRGRISDPVLTTEEEKTEEKREHKLSPEEEEDLYLERMARRIENMRKLGLIPKEKEESSLETEIRKAALPTMINTLVSTVAESVKAAASIQANPEPSSVSQRIVDGIFSDDTMKHNLAQVANNAITGLFNFGSNILARRNGQASPAPVQPEQIQPPAPSQAPPPEKFDLLDYLLTSCEEGKLIDIKKDEKIQAFFSANLLAKMKITGLLMSQPPTVVWEEIIKQAETDGRGERAREVARSANAIPFIEYVQSSFKKA